MVRFNACCIGCHKDFVFDTNDPSVMIDAVRSAKPYDAPQIYIEECPKCGVLNKIEVKHKGKNNE